MAMSAAAFETRSMYVPPAAPFGNEVINQWGLDPTVVFLNHGSFGARPKSVIEAQHQRRLGYERQPLAWLDPERGGRPAILRAKQALAGFINTRPENTGLVTNATGAINAVLRSLTFKPGDELVTTNHVYNAVRQVMRYLAGRAGGTYREIEIPLPLTSPAQVTKAIENGLSDRTRLLMLDQVTSPTALVFPAKEIIDLCRQRGIEIMIDGAHVPGMLPLDVEALGADYYTGNLHKWVSAPSGAAFLNVRPDKQAGIHPAVISHHLDEGLVKEFDWQGTMDITPWLCVEDALAYFAEFGHDRVMRHNHELATWAQAMLCERWEVEPLTPLDGSMIGSMATVRLPREAALKQLFETAPNLKSRLYDGDRIEIPVIDWDGHWHVRISSHMYNRPEQYEFLAETILKIVG
jgi:isopenicillin-N epimerase